MASTMKLGFSLPVSGAWATPANQMRVAREAERLGYHSLWVLQRLLFPVTLHGWPVERTLEVMAALAPDRSLPAA